MDQWVWSSGFYVFFFCCDRCLKEELGMVELGMTEVGHGSWLSQVRCGWWVLGLSSLAWVLMSLWVSQVHHGSLKSGGVGWVLNRCGLWQVLVGCGGSETLSFR